MIYDTLAAMADYNDNNTNWKRNRFDNSPTVLYDAYTVAQKYVAGQLPLSLGKITVRGKTYTDTTLVTAVFFMDGIINRKPMSIVQETIEPYTNPV